LTTRAFAEQAPIPDRPRFGFRNSMKTLIANGALEHAHPSHWAPFVVVVRAPVSIAALDLFRSSRSRDAITNEAKTRSVKKPPASSWQKEIWR